MTEGYTLEQAARLEIEALHAFFVSWFTGADVRLDFRLCEDAFGPDFEMVSPDGRRHTRSAVVARLRQARGTAHGAFDIVVLGTRKIWSAREAISMGYVERQLRDGQSTSRRSVALLTQDMSAPRGMLWHSLAETWMMPEDEA
jgi:hypothetical protein